MVMNIKCPEWEFALYALSPSDVLMVYLIKLPEKKMNLYY